jgi:hypothetical protein
MSDSDRDLVAALRAELAAIDPSRACDRHAEIAGLGTPVHAREPAVARLIIRLGGHARGTTGASRRSFLLPEADLDWEKAPDHCRLAWLRGRFLARGSLSLSSGRAHLEFTVPADEAPRLAARLGDMDLPAAWRLRRGLGVVTWKSGETIAEFLGRIGGNAALLEFEARSVARTLRGELNRVLNAESANLGRSVAAAGRQIAAIDTLEADGRLQVQPYTVRVVAEARRETPEASLSEIAVRLDLHRSAVQRAFDRVERLALHDDEGVGRRVPTRPSGADRGVSHGRSRAGRTAPGVGPVGRGEGRPGLA